MPQVVRVRWWEHTFGKRLTAGEKLDLLNIIYYPRETYAHIKERLPDATARDFLGRESVWNSIVASDFTPLSHGSY